MVFRFYGFLEGSMLAKLQPNKGLVPDAWVRCAPHARHSPEALGRSRSRFFGMSGDAEGRSR